MKDKVEIKIGKGKQYINNGFFLKINKIEK